MRSECRRCARIFVNAAIISIFAWGLICFNALASELESSKAAIDGDVAAVETDDMLAAQVNTKTTQEDEIGDLEQEVLASLDERTIDAASTETGTSEIGMESAAETLVSTDEVDTPSWDYSYTAENNTTTGRLTVDPNLLSSQAFDSMNVTATMMYGEKTVRSVSATFSAADFDETSSVIMDFENYGKFTVSVEFLKDGKSVHIAPEQSVGVVADLYNISPVSATLPVTFFSLNLWGENNIRNDGPVILMMERPAAYNWNALPEGVYGLPYLSPEELSYQPGDFGAAANNFRDHEQAMADYVRSLLEVSPNSTYVLYCVDYYADLVQRIIYANGIPESQYRIVLLSDGSFTPSKISSVYDGTDPASQHEELVLEWNSHKANAYANGQVDAELTPGSCGKYLWALVDSEPNAQLWVARKDLLKTPNDGNEFGKTIQNNPKVVAVSIGSLLATNIRSDANNEAEFKALYNFNDSFFSAAEEQNKDVMMFLGSRVTSEETFVNYARFVMSYYGDDYVYYYKGHPGTPTDLYPEKVAQLESLGIIDVDASIAAELILFFNPEIYLSGYSSSTYASVPVGMGKGMFRMTRSEGLSNPQYENMDFWMTMVSDSTDNRVSELCASGHENYLVEFSDGIAEEKGYSEVGATGTRYIAIWDATTSEIVYYVLNEDETAYVAVGSDSGIGPSVTIKDGVYVIKSALAKNMVLDVAGGSQKNGANVQLYAYNGTNAQKWNITVDDDGYATIINVGSGLALDVSGAKTANKTNVQQWTPNGTKAQKWSINRGSNGIMSITSAINPTISLDISGANATNKTNVQIYASNGSKAQQFQLLPVNPLVSADGQATIADGYYTISSAVNTNLVLAPSTKSLSNGVNLQVQTANNTAYQLFKITQCEDGFYRMESASSGKSIDLDGGSILPGTNVHLWSSSSTNKNQKWAIYEHTGGSMTIQNVKSGLMLDLAGAKNSSGTNVNGYTANGTQAQRWLLHQAADPIESMDSMASDNAQVLSDGTYVIHSALDKNLVLDVRGGSTSNKANVQTYAYNGTVAQQWIVSHDENGYVTFVNKKSGLALDVAGGEAAAGTNVWQYKPNGSPAQKWIVSPLASGGYEIVSAYNPFLILDIKSGSKTPGANVQLYKANGTAAQKFTFEKIS